VIRVARAVARRGSALRTRRGADAGTEFAALVQHDHIVKLGCQESSVARKPWRKLFCRAASSALDARFWLSRTATRFARVRASASIIRFSIQSKCRPVSMPGAVVDPNHPDPLLGTPASGPDCLGLVRMRQPHAILCENLCRDMGRGDHNRSGRDGAGTGAAHGHEASHHAMTSPGQVYLGADKATCMERMSSVCTYVSIRPPSCRAHTCTPARTRA
jgi:hypothetical protein